MSIIIFANLASKTISIQPVYGCIDPLANNYNPLATISDGSCTYDPLPGTNFKFIAIGDPQYESRELFGRGTPLQWAIRDSVVHAANNNPDAEFLLQLGDYMNASVVSSPDQYPMMNEIFDNFTGPQYCVLGNHDVGNGVGTGQVINDFMTKTNFENIGGIQYTKGWGYEKLSNGLHLIVLNATDYSSKGFAAGTSGTGQGNYSREQVQFLQDTLDSITESDAVVLFTTHYPLESSNPPSVGYTTEKTVALEIQYMLSKWQNHSDHGVILPILNGHEHIDDGFEYSGLHGRLSSIVFNDSLPPKWTGYVGTSTTIGTDESFMQYGVCNYNGTSKIFTVDGIGLQNSYSIDLSNRITPPHIDIADSEKPVIGTLVGTDQSFRLLTLNCTGTDNVGIVGWDLYLQSVGGDYVSDHYGYSRTIYSENIDDYVLGQLSKGAAIEVYVIAFDEQGNRSEKSNTLSFVGI